MSRQLDRIDLPDGFVRVGGGAGGLRSGFAAASAPYVTRTFVAPWKERALCDELEELAESLGEPLPLAGRVQGEQLCTFQRQIGSGWSAHLVGVTSYRLWIQARSRDLVRRYTSDAQCRDELRRLGSKSMSQGATTGGRSLPCRLLPGQAVVEFHVTGEQIR